MLFYKSIVSFIAAIAMASIVTALPQANGAINTGKQDTNTGQVNNSGNNKNNAGNNNAGKQNTQPVVPVCSAGTPTCCDSTTPFSSLSPADQAALASLDPALNKALAVGLNCAVSGAQGWYCLLRLSQFIRC